MDKGKTHPAQENRWKDCDVYNGLAFALAGCDLALLNKLEAVTLEAEAAKEDEDIEAKKNLIKAIRNAIEIWEELRRMMGTADLQMLRQQDVINGASQCRICGCTDSYACVSENGEPCYWAEQDLCSACADKVGTGAGDNRIILPFPE